jgi:hypothetical protein
MAGEPTERCSWDRSTIGVRWWDEVGVPYGGQDPRNRPGSLATVWCLVCGEWEDLRLRGDVFLCRDQWRCQERVRRKSESHGRAVRHRRRSAA